MLKSSEVVNFLIQEGYGKEEAAQLTKKCVVDLEDYYPKGVK